MGSYKDIIQRIDMRQLLEDMGFEDINYSSSTYLGFCRFHEDVSTKSFSADLDQKLYHCFGCNISGNAIQLYALWKGVPYYQALIELEDNPVIRDLSKLKISKISITYSKRLKLYKIFSEHLKEHSKHSSYLESRGIRYPTFRKAGVKFLPDNQEELSKLYEQLLIYHPIEDWRQAGIVSDKSDTLQFSAYPIVFPFYYNKEKTIVVYFQARTSHDHTKTRYLSLSLPEGKIPCFYNNCDLNNGDSLMICEGPTDTLSLMELGYSQVVGVPGVGNFQLEWLDNYKGKNITLCFDNDKAGDKTFPKYASLLEQKGFQVSKFKFEGKDINKFLLQQRSIISQ